MSVIDIVFLLESKLPTVSNNDIVSKIEYFRCIQSSTLRQSHHQLFLFSLYHSKHNYSRKFACKNHKFEEFGLLYRVPGETERISLYKLNTLYTAAESQSSFIHPPFINSSTYLADLY